MQMGNDDPHLKILTKFDLLKKGHPIQKEIAVLHVKIIRSPSKQPVTGKFMFQVHCRSELQFFLASNVYILLTLVTTHLL